jgi:hypothetical protein
MRSRRRNPNLLRVPESWVRRVRVEWNDNPGRATTVWLSLADSPYYDRWLRGLRALQHLDVLRGSSFAVVVESLGDGARESGHFSAPPEMSFLPYIRLRPGVSDETIRHELRHLTQWLFDLFREAEVAARDYGQPRAKSVRAVEMGRRILGRTAGAWGRMAATSESDLPMAGVGPRRVRARHARDPEARSPTYREFRDRGSGDEGKGRFHEDYDVELHPDIGSVVEGYLKRSEENREAEARTALGQTAWTKASWVTRQVRLDLFYLKNTPAFSRWKQSHPDRYRYAVQVAYDTLVDHYERLWERIATERPETKPSLSVRLEEAVRKKARKEALERAWREKQAALARERDERRAHLAAVAAQLESERKPRAVAKVEVRKDTDAVGRPAFRVFVQGKPTTRVAYSKEKARELAIRHYGEVA